MANQSLPWATIRQQVYERANGCCEYCRTCETNTGQTMQVDHIDPDGGDEPENLCLSCWNCNNHKRSKTRADDPDGTGSVPLYHPRLDLWHEHFAWINGATRIQGLTPTGRATVEALKFNRPSIVIARQRWASGGFHPPD